MVETLQHTVGFVLHITLLLRVGTKRGAVINRPALQPCQGNIFAVPRSAHIPSIEKIINNLILGVSKFSKGPRSPATFPQSHNYCKISINIYYNSLAFCPVLGSQPRRTTRSV